MLDLIMKFFGKENRSKNVAKERLRLVLLHDRASISPKVIDALKADMIQVISNYTDIDEEALEVNLDYKGNTVALVANIPVKGMNSAVGV